jgi:hypothetical protein
MRSLTEQSANQELALKSGPFAGCPLAYRHRARLMPEAHDRLDEWTRLIEEDTCPALITELETALLPAGPEAALRQAEILIGSYPAREVMNADIFVRAVTSVLAEAPKDVGPAVVDHLTRTLKWLPTRADVAKAVDDKVGPRKTALRCARAHLDEHARRQGAGARESQPKRWSDLSTAQRRKFDTKLNEALAYAVKGVPPHGKGAV